MAKNLVTAQIVFDKLPELRGQLRERASERVRKAAYDIEAGAKQRAPVDTGFLKSSIYTVTDQDSGFDQADTEAVRINPLLDLLPEVDQPGPLQAIVAVGAEYGAFVELGTRDMPPRPYLSPAAEAVRPAFTAAMKGLLDD